jgi:hypothetical protein
LSKVWTYLQNLDKAWAWRSFEDFQVKSNNYGERAWWTWKAYVWYVKNVGTQESDLKWQEWSDERWSLTLAFHRWRLWEAFCINIIKREEDSRILKGSLKKQVLVR